MTLSIFAYFDSIDKAKAAAKALQKRGYQTLLDEIEQEPYDPDLSVSALMVGFLPDISQAIFKTGKSGENQLETEDAYLLAVVTEERKVPEVKRILIRHDGRIQASGN